MNTNHKIMDCSIHGEAVEALINGKCRACVEERNQQLQREALAHETYQAKLKAGIYQIFLNATLDNWTVREFEDPEILPALKQYQYDKNIVMLGSTGTGKTHLACALINKVVTKKSCHYINFYELADLKIHDYMAFKKLIKFQFLVIDEFGVSESDFKNLILYDILNVRCGNNLPTVLISNLSGKKAKELMSDAFYSRLKSNCLSLQFRGKDYRLENAA